MNVVSVWWSAFDGGRGQHPYTGDYVLALMSELNAQGLALTLLSDNEFAHRPLLSPQRYKGWLAKLEVFRPENRDLRPCLCIDLDTFIVGPVQPILDLDPNHLWLIRQFYQGAAGKGESGLFIAPRDGISDTIWEAAEKLKSFERGDGDFLRQFPHRFIPDEVNGIYSYKVHCLAGKPKDARVVAFHGQPKPPDVTGWAADFWKLHAGTP